MENDTIKLQKWHNQQKGVIFKFFWSQTIMKGADQNLGKFLFAENVPPT